MAAKDGSAPVVTAADRDRMRRLGAWQASLPPMSPPPPRTLGQVFEINERLRRIAGERRHDDALAVERHARFRANLLRLDTASGNDRSPAGP